MDKKFCESEGYLLLLNEKRGKKQKVELWLLNDKVNENNWRYEHLAENKDQFAGTPILIAYVGEKIGDGHNFEAMRDENGEVIASFKSATAERIVGYFDRPEDIRTEEKDGALWIVATGYIWKWYAVELVDKLKKRGLRGMPVSIETLVQDKDTRRGESGEEVFSEWEVLGTTILGEDVSPAVRGASIRSLSVFTPEETKSMTKIKVASLNERGEKIQRKDKKNVKIKDVEQKYEGFTVVAVNGDNVALLSASGEPYTSTAKNENGEIVVGSKVALDSVTFGEGEESVAVPVEKVFGALNARIAAAEKERDEANAAKEQAESTLKTMREHEIARRKAEIKKIVKARVNEIREGECDVDENACDGLTTDEALDKYAGMEREDGSWCGDEAAKRDVDALCMDAIVAANKAAAKKRVSLWNNPDAIRENSASGDYLDKAIAQTMGK